MESPLVEAPSSWAGPDQLKLIPSPPIDAHYDSRLASKKIWHQSARNVPRVHNAPSRQPRLAWLMLLL